MILFIKLLLAHLLGDFVLQPDSWVKDKELNQYKSSRLYLHGLVHFILILLVTLKSEMIPIAIAISVSHIFIDAAKLQLQNEKNKKLWFVIDQFFHVLILAVAAWVVASPSVIITQFVIDHLLILTTGIVILLTPSSLIIKMILSKWTPATEFKTEKLETPALLHAGMMIGYLERVLVYIFIISNQWAAIGFLITAKSVFRFSDLKAGQDRKLTEYILIGTLLSFGIAIITGLIFAFVLQQVDPNTNMFPTGSQAPGNSIHYGN